MQMEELRRTYSILRGFQRYPLYENRRILVYTWPFSNQTDFNRELVDLFKRLCLELDHGKWRYKLDAQIAMIMKHHTEDGETPVLRFYHSSWRTRILPDLMPIVSPMNLKDIRNILAEIDMWSFVNHWSQTLRVDSKCAPYAVAAVQFLLYRY